MDVLLPPGEIANDGDSTGAFLHWSAVVAAAKREALLLYTVFF